MAEEERTMREILRSIENGQIELKKDVEHIKESKKDQEYRIRSLEKSKHKITAGIGFAGTTGLWALIKSYIGIS